jgi:hypothetical protein
VAFYELKGVRLAPVQIFEAALGLGLFIGFSLLPASLFGQGRAIGLLLLLLILGRSVLLPFRFRFSDERVGPGLASLLHIGLAAVSVLLLAGAAGRAPSELSHDVSTPSLAWMILAPAAMAIVVFVLFGVHRQGRNNSEKGGHS